MLNDQHVSLYLSPPSTAIRDKWCQKWDGDKTVKYQ